MNLPPRAANRADPVSEHESVSQRLARLRLEAARQDFNARRSGSLSVSSRSKLAQANLSQLTDAASLYERSTGSQALSSTQAGPIPASWRPREDAAYRRRKLLGRPADNVDDPLVRARDSLLSALPHDPRLSESKRPLALTDLCLAILAFLLSEKAEDLFDYVKTLPVQQKHRLMVIGAGLAPLTEDSAEALLYVPDTEEDCESTWDSLEIDEGQGITQIDLSFSDIRITSLKTLLFHSSPTAAPLGPKFPFLESLSLCSMPHLQLSSKLLSILAALPNLKVLRLIDLDPPTSQISSEQFVARLPSCTVNLRELDLSHNDWLEMEHLEGVQWSHHWKHLKILAVRSYLQKRTRRIALAQSTDVWKDVTVEQQEVNTGKQIWDCLVRRGRKAWIEIIV